MARVTAQKLSLSTRIGAAFGLILNSPESRSNLAEPDDWFVDALTGPESSTGIRVTPESALKWSAVFCAIRIISESIASLPIHLYETKGKGRSRVFDHPLVDLLDNPNSEMTRFELFEVLQSHLCLRGNCYAQKVMAPSGAILELVPLPVSQVSISRSAADGSLLYTYQDANGKTVFGADEIVHVRGLGSDGVVGYSPVTLAREAIGLGLAAERFGGKLFKNGARPSAIVKHPKRLSEQVASRLRSQLESIYSGIDNSHRIAVLEEGMEWEKTGFTPEDAQFLGSRKFQISEIARIFRVPPHMMADLEKATFSNIEHQSQEFVTHTLRPWLVRWEHRLNRTLLEGEDRRRYKFEFSVEGLLRGDTTTRYAAYSTGRNWGWLSVNDIRRFENLSELPPEEGDVYLQPLNMQPLGALPPPAPAAKDPPDEDPPEEDKKDKPEEKNSLDLTEASKALLPMALEAFDRFQLRASKGIAGDMRKGSTLESAFAGMGTYLARGLRPTIASALNLRATVTLSGEVEEEDIDLATSRAATAITEIALRGLASVKASPDSPAFQSELLASLKQSLGPSAATDLLSSLS